MERKGIYLKDESLTGCLQGSAKGPITRPGKLLSKRDKRAE